jgi:hypothetical protein
MNICKGVLFCLALAFMPAACKSPSDKVVDEFNRVDSSLGSVAKTVNDDSLTLLAVSILAMQQGPNRALVKAADSIYLSAKEAIDMIDSLKIVLSDKDATGDSLGVALQLMEDNNTGGQLYHGLSSECYYSSRNISSDTSKKGDNPLCSDISETPTAEVFVQKYFRQTPTIAARTILTKFRYDCNLSAITALNNIKGQLKYK